MFKRLAAWWQRVWHTDPGDVFYVTLTPVFRVPGLGKLFSNFVVPDPGTVPPLRRAAWWAKTLARLAILAVFWVIAQAVQWLVISATVAIMLYFLGIIPARAATIIPTQAEQHKALLIRAARVELGLNAPTATLAAQIHTESRWRANAVSPVGAQGLAQFMPATSAWLPQVAPQTGQPLPFNPAWALRAVCAYNSWHLARIKNAHAQGDQWTFTLWAYNGGLGWVNKDRAQAATQGKNPAKWREVEPVNAGRSKAAFMENRNYTRAIFAAQAAYEAAGWGPGVTP